MKQIVEKYQDEFEFEVISGGMVTGERVQPASVMADYILGAYKQVEDRTGVTFGEPFLDMLRDGTRIQSSFEPALVLRTFKTFLPEKAVLFAHDLQKMNYSQLTQHWLLLKQLSTSTKQSFQLINKFKL
jgi:putative protein-disulfide isomerase